ncbi:stalk domain-containing protein [Cohnella cholangitidis]|uniref:Copper amine oxidase n=1 Tax=Cohnella cholangitidis TaxID=2598458 RepID=A0A7G5C3V5_9BACL|nr:stalk domain-containing protein [Cohnella cholangitidis]QMV43889.1 copper amine oxidase [Cohnella cholangitidis]
MKANMKSLISGSIGLIVALSSPVAAFAASDTSWTKSTKLYEVRTWTGQSELGHVNGTLSEATFYHPRSAVALPDGKLLVSDSSNHLIRAVSVDRVSGYAGLDLGEDEANLPYGGYNDAELAKAAFELPSGLALDSQGNVYVADTKNNAIRKISKDGKVSTLAGNGSIGSADGVGANAAFYEPSDVAVDRQGNVYVADTLNHVIRKIAANGTVTTLTAPSTRITEYFPGAVETAGDYSDGAIASAKFNEPSGLALDSKGNLYVSDRGNQRIRYIDFASGKVSTVAGGGALGKQASYVEGDFVDGTAAQSRFNAPEGLTVTEDGSVIIADSLNHAIRIVKDGKVSTLAGIPTEFGKNNGLVASAQFNHPTDVTVLSDGRLVIVDEFGNKVRVLQKYAKPASLPAGQSVSVLYNGKLVPTEVPAQVKANAVLLPLRDVGNALGYEVSYDKATGNSVLAKGDIVYKIGNGTNAVTKSVAGKSETLTLNAKTVTVNNRLFVPVRFFASESDLDIQWDASSQLVVIRSKVF